MSQYVANPFDKEFGTTAINLVQPRDETYPVVPGQIRKVDDRLFLVRTNGGEETVYEVVDSDGRLEDIPHDEDLDRLLVLSPGSTDTSSTAPAVLGVQRVEGSAEYVAVRPVLD